MKNFDVTKMLEKMNIPFAYRAFEKKTTLPFLVFYQNGSDNFGADNKVHLKGNRYVIELYTKQKDFNLEEKLENILDEAEVYWEKSEDVYIDTEKMNEVIYFI